MITPIDIQQHQFSMRFRGFDVQEVDEFLELIARTLEALYDDNDRLVGEMDSLKHEIKDLKAREEAVSRAAGNSEKLVEQMNETARKSAESIISDAKNQAEKILNKANGRLSQLHEDILQLKSQRIQMEAQFSSIIEAHHRLLEMGRSQMRTRDGDYEKEQSFRQQDNAA